MKRRRSFVPSVLAAAVCIAAPLAVLAQEPAKATPGAIVGTLAIDGKPAPNVGVMITRELFGADVKPAGATTSDKEGRFRFDDVEAGRYYVIADAPALVVDEEAVGGERAIVVGEGETIKGVTVALRRGGVITGRLTNTDGAALVRQRVTVERLSADGKPRQINLYARDVEMQNTDDRGVYRIYGLSPGTYLVSAGRANDGMTLSFGFGPRQYSRAYFPGVATSAEARRIEVAAGSEASGIDFALSERATTYAITGTVVDADTGEPLAGVPCGYGPSVNGALRGSWGYAGASGKKGEFTLAGLAPGTYLAMAMSQGAGSSKFSDMTPFEITTENLSGIVIKMHSGASISGVVVLEGHSATDAQEFFSRTGLVAGTPRDENAPYDPTMHRFGRITGEGTFEIDGLRPGSYEIGLSGMTDESPATIVRIERGGTPADGPIAVGAAEAITDVRIVLALGTGVIRGQVSLVGSFPVKKWTFVEARAAGSDRVAKSARVEADGTFAFAQMPPGDYTLTATTSFEQDGHNESIKGSTVTVTVGPGKPAVATLVVERGTTEGGGSR